MMLHCDNCELELHPYDAGEFQDDGCPYCGNSLCWVAAQRGNERPQVSYMARPAEIVAMVRPAGMRDRRCYGG